MRNYRPARSTRLIPALTKSRSAKVVFKEFREVRKELWGGEFWSDGYFMRSVGDEVTAEVIRQYVEYHNSKQLVFEF